MPNSRREREEAIIQELVDEHRKLSQEIARMNAFAPPFAQTRAGVLCRALQVAHKREDAIRGLIRLAEAPDPRYGGGGVCSIDTGALKRILDREEPAC